MFMCVCGYKVDTEESRRWFDRGWHRWYDCWCRHRRQWMGRLQRYEMPFFLYTVSQKHHFANFRRQLEQKLWDYSIFHFCTVIT